ncbi:MAG TPA: sigma-70 family RNA polymerase sigma factor [Fimbriimonas sp.]|nr:sigma-70 family RNA polymerase sigma factor [Fimbriimonas sp.]
METSFRKESARLVSLLVRAFGPSRLSLAEDVVQETFLRAVQLWPKKGTPENPTAWLTRVARNLAIDHLRREGIYLSDGQEILEQIPEAPADPSAMGDPELEMLFLCCHPSLPAEAQVALTLRELCGLSSREIAKALLVNEDALSQRLVRAKRALADVEWSASPEELAPRLDAVHNVLYLLFNEGYAAHTDPALTRSDLCDEAIILTDRLSRTRIGDVPATHALLALMLLHSSRLAARLSPEGALELLEEQDRSLWDQRRLAAGLQALDRSAQGQDLTRFHLEAGIAAEHALAPTFGQTNWRSVLSQFDDLARLHPSVVVLLNRAIAVSMVHGDERALAELEAIEASGRLDGYYLLPATKAKFLSSLGRHEDAREAYKRALDLAKNPAERAFLEGKLAMS